jgi:hypothetical protein
MPVANFEKKPLSFSNVRKRHTSKVLIILNLLRSYCNGVLFTEGIYQVFYLKSISSMEWTLAQTNIKNERFSSSNDQKFTRVQCSYFLTKWGPIDIFLIPIMNKTSLHLKSIWSPEGKNPDANLKWMAQLQNRSRFSHE